MINVNGRVNVFNSNQNVVMYAAYNAPKYPAVNAVLLPSTDVDLPTYSSGRLLSIVTAANATDPALVGCYLNFDPTSTNPDQLVPTHVISGEFVVDAVGLDNQNSGTAAETLNIVPANEFLIGVTFYKNTLVAANSVAAYAAFEAYYILSKVTTTQLQGEDCDVLTVQGVA